MKIRYLLPLVFSFALGASAAQPKEYQVTGPIVALTDDVITVVAGKHVGSSSCRTLDELMEHLDPAVFWRVHRSHVVNINKVKEIVPWFNRNYVLKMKDEKSTEIPVSRTQTKRLREYLKI